VVNFEAEAEAKAKGVCSELKPPKSSIPLYPLCLYFLFKAETKAEGVCSKINPAKSAKSASSAFYFLPFAFPFSFLADFVFR